MIVSEQPPNQGQLPYQPEYPPNQGQLPYQPGYPPNQSQPPYQGYGQPGGGWQQPEVPGPALGVSFASHGARLGAYILDAIIVGLIMSMLFVALVVAVGSSIDWTQMTHLDRYSTPDEVATVFRPWLVLIPGIILVSILGLLYFPFFWARRGPTPGMMMAGIRVVRDRDGGRVGWGAAILRLIGYWVSGALLYLGFIWVLIDGRRRGWHDLIAGTCVISSR
jgi:uncharacterized RDD family membrane protein YckC